MQTDKGTLLREVIAQQQQNGYVDFEYEGNWYSVLSHKFRDDNYLSNQKEQAKQQARYEALQKAAMVQRKENFDITKEAEKIYQWLIKNI